MAARTVVVFDANAIIPNFELGTPSIRALIERARATGSVVAIPEVVIREVVAKRTSILDGLLKKLLTPIHRELGLKIDPTPGPLQADFDAAFRARLKQEGISILPLPTTHDETIARAIAKVPPFDDGAKGYRDALVWAAILDAARGSDDTVLLVTADSEFGPPAPAGVARKPTDATEESDTDPCPWHPSLETELREIGAADRVLRVRTPRAALHAMPEEPSPPEQPADIEVESLVAQQMEKVAADLSVDSVNLDGLDITEVTVDTCEDATVRDVRFVSATNPSELTYTAYLTVQCTLLGFAHKWEAFAESGGLVHVVDGDWNEWVAQVSFNAAVGAELVVELHHEDGEWKVAAVEVADVAVEPDTDA